MTAGCQRLLLALALGAVGAPAAASSPSAPAIAATPIVIGTQMAVDYAPGDTRQINVYLPDHYAEGQARYPVLYVIDGGLAQDFLQVTAASQLNAVWGRSLPVIVVGIETKDRRAELIGDHGNAEEQRRYPTAGDAARFRAFLRNRVKPLIAERFRTNGDDAVIGESLAGLFITETWATEPTLFARYAAIDPSLWWHDGALAQSAAARTTDGQARRPILMSYANDGPATERGVATIAAAAGASACVLARPDLTHATAYHTLLPQALQFLFPTNQHFDPEWGFDVPCATNLPAPGGHAA